MSSLTDNEHQYLEQIRQGIADLQAFLNEHPLDSNADTTEWFMYLAQIRAIQGNTSNDFSFLACLLAKRYLASRFDLGDFDVAAKPQGAPGLDIDVTTPNGKRIIGEIKTTVPYSGAKNDLGAQQKTSFKKDFDKLNAASADYKFFFVTDLKTYKIVQQRYAKLIPGVEVVLLGQTEPVLPDGK